MTRSIYCPLQQIEKLVHTKILKNLELKFKMETLKKLKTIFTETQDVQKAKNLRRRIKQKVLIFEINYLNIKNNWFHLTDG